MEVGERVVVERAADLERLPVEVHVDRGRGHGDRDELRSGLAQVVRDVGQPALPEPHHRRSPRPPPVLEGLPERIGLGQVGDDPVGLHTPGGITLGSRVVDLLAEFPEAVVNPGEPQSEIPDNFYVSTVFYGLLTGVTPDDYITVLFGGYGCFE